MTRPRPSILKPALTVRLIESEAMQPSAMARSVSGTSGETSMKRAVPARRSSSGASRMLPARPTFMSR